MADISCKNALGICEYLESIFGIKESKDQFGKVYSNMAYEEGMLYAYLDLISDQCKRTLQNIQDPRS